MPRRSRKAELAELEREAADVTAPPRDGRAGRAVRRRIAKEDAEADAARCDNRHRVKKHPEWRVALRRQYAAAIAGQCEHCGTKVASELHHHRRKRRDHAAPSQLWRKAGGARSAVERQWAEARATTVALCAPCHSFLEVWQGPARSRPLPFKLDAGGARVGPCACPRCAE